MDRRSTSRSGPAAAAARPVRAYTCRRGAPGRSYRRPRSDRRRARRAPRRAAAPATTAASSGPRSAPVSARRSAFRSPPTAFNSRTTLRASRPRFDELAEAGQRSRRKEAVRRPCSLLGSILVLLAAPRGVDRSGGGSRHTRLRGSQQAHGGGVRGLSRQLLHGRPRRGDRLLETARRIRMSGSRPAGDVYLVLTTNEEVGGVGGAYASRTLPEGVTLALEVGPTEKEYGTSVGGGPSSPTATRSASTTKPSPIADRHRRQARAAPQAAVLGAFESDASHAKAGGLALRRVCSAYRRSSYPWLEVISWTAIGATTDILMMFRARGGTPKCIDRSTIRSAFGGGSADERYGRRCPAIRRGRHDLRRCACNRPKPTGWRWRC